MAMKLHGIATSTCVARSMLCLYEKDLEFELIHVDVANSAHKKQPYLSLNPFGQIPAFEDGDIKIFESRAISKFLACKNKDIGIDLLGLSSLTESHQFNVPMQKIIRQMVVNPLYGVAPDDKIIETEMEKLGKVLDVYEERLSKSKYLAGDFYSFADLHHIPYLIYLMRTPRSSIVISRSHVSAWRNSISSRPATVKVAEAMTLKP